MSSAPNKINGYTAPLSNLPRDIHREFLRVASTLRDMREALNALQSGGNLTLADGQSITLRTTDGKGTVILTAGYDPGGNVVLKETDIKTT